MPTNEQIISCARAKCGAGESKSTILFNDGARYYVSFGGKSANVTDAEVEAWIAEKAKD